MQRLNVVVVAAVLLASTAPASADPALSLPIACTVGRDCYIQNYVDHDSTAGSQDYHCGPRTYDTHNGTDFRLPDTATQRRGVAVLAVADGVVERTPDSMADISTQTTGRAAVRGKECGNGLVIRHADGWTSQYCHLAHTSLVVKPGQQVKSGDKLGQVGLSGDTEFPHVHVSIRKDGKIVDPFAYPDSASCGPGQSLWQPALQPQLQYRPTEVLNVGFSSQTVTMESIEQGQSNELSKDGPIIAYARTIGLRAGDVQSLKVTLPDGKTLVERTFPPSEGNKAQAFIALGKRNAAVTGRLSATYTITRDGADVLQRSFDADLN
ncbi:M23 family metallopeptidase [Rhodopseudomonas sp. HC1]|uniref:M23 family metallopeptidase n=1 Tax=Rhodopseudomonas infernalis TaxID=2897386 RepID=UPI001EE87327|nr:M23 family metallopeptidase [Rhodopseudomonas infernalis]MCG6206286.1 M23 family metallopeptidase [Rhodopseudomonas infernalis]